MKQNKIEIKTLSKYCLKYLNINHYEVIAKKLKISVSSVYNHVHSKKQNKKNADKINEELIILLTESYKNTITDFSEMLSEIYNL